MSIIVALLIFSFIVFIHELGHYIFARRAGIAVEEFAIGMGPKLFGFTRNHCEWTIRMLPIGGFCKMVGEDGAGSGLSDGIMPKKNSGENDDSEMDSDNEILSESHEMIESMEGETVQDTRESEASTDAAAETSSEASAGIHESKTLNGDPFYVKSVPQRMMTIFGGPLFNFILALLFSFIYVAVTPMSSTTIDAFGDNSPASEAGIILGDEVISIDGQRVLAAFEPRVYINVAGGEPLDIVVKRSYDDGTSERLNFSVEPEALYNLEEPIEEQTPYWRIGVSFGPVENSLGNIITWGVRECLAWIKIVFYSLGMLLTGQVGLNQLSGPVGIVDVIGEGVAASASIGILAVISSISSFVVLLSANLGVMNLLPIPALDGARLVFLVIEGVRGKPVPQEKEGFIHFVGFMLLMVLMVFVLFNDVSRLITG